MWACFTGPNKRGQTPFYVLRKEGGPMSTKRGQTPFYVLRKRDLVLAVGIGLATLFGLSRLTAQAPSRQTVTPADYLRWRTELRNWGRWGPNDQKGTAN